MIRHAGGGLTLTVSALAVSMIESALLRLLMPAVGGAVADPAGEFAARLTAIDLAPFTRWANEEDDAASWGVAEALPERKGATIRHVRTGIEWTAETEGGKIQPKWNWCFGNGAFKLKPRLLTQPGLKIFISVPDANKRPSRRKRFRR